MAEMIGILLAAGSGRRFGSDKLMQTMADGEPIAVHAYRRLSAGTDRVLAVVRPGSDALANRLRAEGADVRICPDAEQGMSRSLVFGINAVPEAKGWLIALADMPCIGPATIKQVAGAVRSGALIAAPCRQGRRGHPVGFSAFLYEELTRLSGDAGAKSVIQSHRDRLHVIDVDDPGIFRDIDRPEDLIQLNPVCL